MDLFCPIRYLIEIRNLRNNPVFNLEIKSNVPRSIRMSLDTKNDQKYIQLPYWINSIVKKVWNNEYFIKWKTVILKCIVEWIENVSPFVA